MQTAIDISLFLFGAIVATLIICIIHPSQQPRRGNPFFTVGDLRNRLARYPDAMEIQLDAVDDPVYCPVLTFTVEERCDEIERLYIGIAPEEQ